MIYKIDSEGMLHTLGEGKLMDVHISAGYVEGEVEVDANGKYFEYYNQNGTVDTDKIASKAEELRVQGIKAKARELILGVYPLWKQNDVLMDGVEDDVNAMKAFIGGTRDISNTAETDGTAIDDIDWTINE